MTGMSVRRGDVVIARYPFTDLSGTKPRPALVIGVRTAGPDVILAFVSKVIAARPSSFEYVLLPTDPEFPLTGLRFPSVFRMDKIVTLSRILLARHLGRVGPRMAQQLEIRLRAALGL